MFVISPTRDELKAAAFVAGSVNLGGITLLSVSTSGTSNVEARAEFKHALVRFAMRQFSIPRPGHLQVEVELVATLSREEASGEPAGAGDRESVAISLVQLAEYSLPTAPIPEEYGEGAIEQFARWNALVNCWPYFRAEIQRLSAAMGMPTYTLPLLIVRAKAAKTAQEQEVPEQQA